MYKIEGFKLWHRRKWRTFRTFRTKDLELARRYANGIHYVYGIVVAITLEEA